MKVVKNRRTRRRSGVAAVELALMLPVLALILGAGTDYSRMFRALVVLSDAARAGAVYGATDKDATSSMIQQVALAEAADLSPPPTVTSTRGTDALGNATIEVTLTYTFQSLVPSPSAPPQNSAVWSVFHTSKVLSRTVVMTTDPS